MTRKSSILVGAAVVLLGVGTYAALNQSSDAPAAPKPGKPTTAKAEGDKGNSAKPDASNARASRERPAASSYPDLAEKYGESRTNLSRHVVDGFIGVLDEVLALSESAEGLGKGFGGGQSLGKLPEKLNLTAEQQEAAKKLLAERQKRQIEQAKALSESMRKEPRQLVELTLAGDARARNQISVEEYESIAKRTEDFLKNSTGGSELGIGMRNRGDRDALFNDPEARAGFEKILDPTQAETFQQLAAEKTPAKDEGEQISKTFPPMELEKLDQTLTSTRTMMEGMRKMMEGAKSLPEGSKFGQ